jgi:type I restriction enzyme R subunit
LITPLNAYGLTATPDQRTFAFFNENVVSEYTHEEAVTDGVNVGFDVYTIETEITQQGSRLVAKEFVDKRDKLTRKRRWEQLDEDFTYSGKQLDRDVVNPSQMRNIIRAFRDKLPEIFPNRKEVPKTLIFAKTDSHADDIIQIVREEFGEGNAFCKKVTYQSKEDPKSLLAQFRNDYYPRIAVTVDMIATGTDVKPLECLLFMRDVKSRNYFEQMKGRGTRTLGADDLKKVTPSALSHKTHFVIVDAVGVTQSLKTDSRPLERRKGVPLRDLMMGVMMGAQDEDVFTSLAGRLARLDQQMNPQERERLLEMTGGLSAGGMAKALLQAYDPDRIADKARTDGGLPNTAEPSAGARQTAQQALIRAAAGAFTGEVIDFIENLRRAHEQIIDTVNLDRVTAVGWDVQAKERAMHLIEDFTAFIERHKNEIAALKIYYNQPYRRCGLTFQMIREVLDILKTQKPTLAPLSVWQAYEQVEGKKAGAPISELTALVALIRKVVGLDQELTPYERTVNRNFQQWVFQKQAGAAPKFTEAQMEWLRMVKDHMISSFHIERDDLDYAPFDAQGGLAKMYQLFGEEMDGIIDEMNEALAA